MSTKNVLAVVLFALWMAGCMAYRGDAVPRIDPSTIAVSKIERVISYDMKVDSNVGDDFEIQGIAVREVEAALRAAGADLKPSGAVADADETMTVRVTASGSVPAQMLSGFISGLTFTVIPGYAGVDIALDATVTARDGTKHEYRYADRFTLWIQLLLLPLSNNPDRVLKELLADMARSLARDMQRDGLLPRPTGAPAAQPRTGRTAMTAASGSVTAPPSAARD